MPARRRTMFGLISGRSSEAAFLICPRCRLSIRASARWQDAPHCPRCTARAGVPVQLFHSTLPASELYDDGPGSGASRRLRSREAVLER